MKLIFECLHMQRPHTSRKFIPQPRSYTRESFVLYFESRKFLIIILRCRGTRIIRMHVASCNEEVFYYPQGILQSVLRIPLDQVTRVDVNSQEGDDRSKLLTHIAHTVMICFQ